MNQIARCDRLRIPERARRGHLAYWGLPAISRMKNFPESHVRLIYYMAPSHKDWELPNSRIWLAELDIDRGFRFFHLDRHLDR